MTLFEHNAKQHLAKQAPLAARMRPRSFDEYVGQNHIIGPGKILRRSIEADQIPSMILWGPPGIGKTTLASLIASITSSHFETISAVTSGVADLRRIVTTARERLGQHTNRTILFIDEIHRFNKSQQDVILPFVEDGTIVLIGATTENPSFEVNSPLLSRSRVFVLEALTDIEIKTIIDRALSDPERGLSALQPALDDLAMRALVKLSNGDARIVLNTLELAVTAMAPNDSGVRKITIKTIEDAAQRRTHVYDKHGDSH